MTANKILKGFLRERKKPLEITCWRAKALGEIRIGRWREGVFDRVAGVPVTGEFIRKAQLRKAEALRDRLNEEIA